MLNFTAMTLTIGPELWLAAAGLLGVLLGALMKDAFNGLAFKFGALALFGAAAIAALFYAGGEAFNGLVRTNTFVNFAKIVAFAIGGFALLMSEGFMKRQGTGRYEYALLTIFAALGMGVILSAADLMTLYMGVETLSLSSYVLAAFHRDSARSSEAGLKYFVLGALASGMLLYGASLVYGFTGTTSFAGIADAKLSTGMMFGMVLMISGLAFKISAAPMHVWTPDVYEGAPTPVGAFFSSAPKMASIVVFANVMFQVFGDAMEQWRLIIAIIAGLSMIIGSFGALTQTNIKRLLGYSSIANVGYALVAVAAGQKLGAGPLLVFMTIYAISSLGLFAGVLAMRRPGGMVEGINELGGLMRKRPWLTVALSILVWSVAGLPPFGGFFGKLAVFQAGIEAGLMPLAIILVIASVVSLGYYLRLIKIMWFDEPTERFEAIDGSVTFVVLVSALIAGILFMFFIYQLGWWTDQAALGLGS
ncbi:MAG: NADH-quinone oxidoreductase subunit NuoN [Hyphomonas sp.]|nr:NADH-quinone oxidoreductase subunit NuoN [Hyphomonas sp.]MCB9971721.1 NADH-quinone oxidoreductase subunit NuoN [Hyphomonas sp.]